MSRLVFKECIFMLTPSEIFCHYRQELYSDKVIDIRHLEGGGMEAEDRIAPENRI